jgi:MFS family permease
MAQANYPENHDVRTSTRLTNTIFVTQSLFSASQIAIFTLLSIMAVELSGSESNAGLPSTTMTLAQSAMALPIGILMGRMGRRLGLTLGYASGALGALTGILAIVTGTFALLLVSAALMGAGRASADQSRFAAGDLFTEDKRARMIGRIVFAGTIGAVFGPSLVAPSQSLSGLLGLDINTGPWVLGMAFYALASVITFIFLRPEPMTIARHLQGDPDKPKVDEKTRRIPELLRLPSVQLAIFGMLVSQTVMVTLMVITPLHMHHHAYGSGEVSIVIMAHTLGMFGLSSLTGRLIDRYGQIKMLLAGAIILVISAVLAPVSTSMFILITSLFLLGLGWNFGYIAGSSLLSQSLTGAERGRIQGLNDMLVAFAAAMGSLSSGPLFALGGFGAVAVMGLVMTLLLMWIIRLLSPMVLTTDTSAITP